MPVKLNWLPTPKSSRLQISRRTPGPALNIVLVPLIAAIAYEFIRAMANLYHYRLVRAILAPGLALQKMTTRPPDLSMLEVGIAALKAVLAADGLLLPSHLEEATEPETALA